MSVTSFVPCPAELSSTTLQLCCQSGTIQQPSGGGFECVDSSSFDDCLLAAYGNVCIIDIDGSQDITAYAVPGCGLAPNEGSVLADALNGNDGYVFQCDSDASLTISGGSPGATTTTSSSTAPESSQTPSSSTSSTSFVPCPAELSETTLESCCQDGTIEKPSGGGFECVSSSTFDTCLLAAYGNVCIIDIDGSQDITAYAVPGCGLLSGQGSVLAEALNGDDGYSFQCNSDASLSISGGSSGITTTQSSPAPPTTTQRTTTAPVATTPDPVKTTPSVSTTTSRSAASGSTTFAPTTSSSGGSRVHVSSGSARAIAVLLLATTLVAVVQM